MNRFKIFFLIFIIFAIESYSMQDSFYAEVIKVADGDTVTVKTESGAKTRIRLYGVDSPELKQESGADAKQFTEKLLLKKKVRVDVKDRDSYGRLVADIYIGNLNFNKEIVKNGYAWYFRKYLKNSIEMEKLENEAKKSKIGLWKNSSPVPPWKFRDKKRGGTNGIF